jgi:hypothetical protein
VTSWSFLTSHARVLPCIVRDPGARLRDLAASPGITGRSAHGIATGLAEAGYVIRQKDGRRNRYRILARLPVPEPGTREPASARSSPSSQPRAGPHPRRPQAHTAIAERPVRHPNPCRCTRPSRWLTKKGGPPMSTAKKLNPSPC